MTSLASFAKLFVGTCFAHPEMTLVTHAKLLISTNRGRLRHQVNTETFTAHFSPIPTTFGGPEELRRDIFGNGHSLLDCLMRVLNPTFLHSQGENHRWKTTSTFRIVNLLCTLARYRKGEGFIHHLALHLITATSLRSLTITQQAQPTE